MKKILITLFIIFISISQTNAWLGLIAENGDLLNIAKWNELVNNKLSRVDLKAGDNITLTNSGSEIYINGVVSGNGVPYISSVSKTNFSKNDNQHVILTGRNLTPETTVSTPAGAISNLVINSPTELEFDITTIGTAGIYNVVLDNDGVNNSYWTGNGVDLFFIVAAYHSCLETYNDGNTTDGNYSLVGTDGVYDAYCDMTTDGGGWTRIVRTNGDNQEWGQKNDNYTYAANGDDTGIYNAYRYVDSFDKTMLKHIDSGDWASYNLVDHSSDTIYGLMSFCKGQAQKSQDDNAWDGARTKGMTSEYSGTKVAGSMANVNYFFMCGVNEDSDNDQAYMSFSRETGQVGNGYADSWRGTSQTKTTWALLNGDYYTSSNTHIGNGYSQAGAGKKADGSAGHYEVYIR